MQLTLLQDIQSELLSGGLRDSYEFNTDISVTKDYSVRQRAYATAPYSNNFTNNYQSFGGSYNVYAFGSTLS